MPVPLIPLAIALTAGSVLANQYGQSKVNKERAAQLERDLAQRAAHEKTARVAADTTLEKMASTGARETIRAKELAAAAKANQAPLTPGKTPTVPLREVGVSPRLIETLNADRAGARGFADRLADDRGTLSAFGDIMLGNQIEAGRNAQDIREAGIASNNYTRDVLPHYLNAANMKGQPYFTLGDLLGLGASFAWPAALANPGMSKYITTSLGKVPRNMVDLSTLRPPPGAFV